MDTGKNDLSQYKNWLRLFTLVDYGGRRLCYDVLFNKENLPTDGVELYRKLEPLKSRICRFDDQRGTLCPRNGFTNHNDFDLTLYTRIKEVMFGSKYASLVKKLRDERNNQCHKGNKELADADFDKLWKCTADMLEKFGFDLSLVDGLKDGDPFLDQRFKDITTSIQGK